MSIENSPNSPKITPMLDKKGKPDITPEKAEEATRKIQAEYSRKEAKKDFQKGTEKLKEETIEAMRRAGFSEEEIRKSLGKS